MQTTLVPWATRRIGFGLPTTMLAIAALLFAAGLALPSPILAQDEPDPEEDLFLEVVDVNLVNIDVYVTDRQGNRITGLTADDFELLVDKKPTPISHFAALEGGRPTHERVEPIERQPESQGAAATAERRLEAEERPDAEKLYLIVYIDNFNLRPFNRNRVIRATRTFLRSKTREGDEVMLVSYDRSLKIRHPFTKDPELIATALYELEEVTGHKVHFDNERRDLLSMVYNDARDIWDVRGRVTQYAESIYNDMAFTIDALRDQVEMLAGLPGRKAILYVSDGLSMRAGEDLFYALNDKFPSGGTGILLEGQRFDMSRRFQSLISQANADSVTFYTFDAAGLRTYSYMDASNHTAGGGAQIDQIHFSNIQSPLLFLAEETGGFAVINTNNFAPGLNKMAEDFDTYYSLGFTPGDTDSGRYHRVKIRMIDKPKGVKLRYREGYRSKPLSARMADGAMASLNFGYEKDQLGLRLEAGRGTPQDNGQFLVPFVLQIPMAKLSYLPQADMKRGRVKLYIAAKDSEGGIAEVQEVVVPIDIPLVDWDRAKDQNYHYQMTLLMRRGRQIVSVGVRDEIGALKGFVSRRLDVGRRR